MPSIYKFSIFMMSAGLIMTMAGCNVAGKNPSYDPYSSHFDNYNKPGNGNALVSVYDLINQDYQYTTSRLQARGFEPKGYMKSGDANLSWWYNKKTDQCVEMRSSDGKTRRLNSKPTADCKNAPQGGNSAGQQQGGGNRFPGVPQTAKSACIKRFGANNFDKIKSATPLKPGFWEILIKGKGKRQVACTVDQYGKISNWVQL